MFKLLSSLLALAVAVSGTKHFEIVNNCPFAGTLYINGQSQGNLAAQGGVTTRDFEDGFSGFIYTTLNHGNADGSSTTRAGFFGDSNYYYLVRDPNWINVDVSISTTNTAPVRSNPPPLAAFSENQYPLKQGNFCATADCTFAEGCSSTDAFGFPPTRFPPVTSTPPSLPLYQCPQAGHGYRVTFCPSGEFPDGQTGSDTINPNGNGNKCLDVRGNVLADGTPVQIYDCNGTGAQQWSIARGSTKVRLAGTNFCLDAGSTPGNGVQMKIWTCYDNLPAQQWYYTDDNRISLEGRGQCLDLTGGILTNSNPIQTWQCTDGNTNQIWL